MKAMPLRLTLAMLFCGTLATELPAQDNVLTYQGRVRSGGSDFTGTGQFKFALVTVSNAASTATATANLAGGFVTSYTVTHGGGGYVTPPGVTVTGGGGSGATATAQVSGGVLTGLVPGSAGSGYTSAPTVTIEPPPESLSFTTHWSNDGTGVDGSEPTDAVSLPVSDGLFSVRLGASSVPNMMALSPNLFDQPGLELRLWFDDGVNGFAALSPTQPLSAVPYSFEAAHAMTMTLGTISDPTFIGTTTSAPLEFFVNNTRGLRLEPIVEDIHNLGIVNVVGGSPANSVGSGVHGAVIAGGGAVKYSGSPSANRVDADYGTIGGGLKNSIGPGSEYSTIGGGLNNIVRDSANSSTISGGNNNVIFADTVRSTIGGGGSNRIFPNATHATISGGTSNTIQTDAFVSTIGGGSGNQTLPGAFYATIPGGRQNSANHYALAAGNRAQAIHAGSFVWADSQNEDVTSARDNQFKVGADGGVYFELNDSHWVEFRRQSSLTLSARLIWTSTGAYLSEGGVWANASDAAKKENFEPVDPQDVLEAVGRLPLQTWNYRIEEDEVRHLGPTAQDFQAAFGFGGDDKAISTVDADGVALAAIQGLNQKVEAQRTELNRKETQIAELRQRLQNLEQRFNTLVENGSAP